MRAEGENWETIWKIINILDIERNSEVMNTKLAGMVLLNQQNRKSMYWWSKDGFSHPTSVCFMCFALWCLWGFDQLCMLFHHMQDQWGEKILYTWLGLLLHVPHSCIQFANNLTRFSCHILPPRWIQYRTHQNKKSISIVSSGLVIMCSHLVMNTQGWHLKQELLQLMSSELNHSVLSFQDWLQLHLSSWKYWSACKWSKQMSGKKKKKKIKKTRQGVFIMGSVPLWWNQISSANSWMKVFFPTEGFWFCDGIFSPSVLVITST